ncbi:MAG: hypothetical protein ACJAVI_002126 [Candidatus Azotimanducaceae bacterium]|jgi:hypothetical protein
MEGIDKRDYYRLNDQVQVSYQIVSSADVKTHAPDAFFDLPLGFHITREIYELELEARELLRGITDNNRQLGSFLHNLNKKIELLAHAVASGNLASDNLVADKQEAVSRDDSNTIISEGGLSFHSKELINKGEFLALKLVLHPSLVGITSFAEVRHCRIEEQESTYQVGVQFLNLSLNSQRLVSRHILRRQSDERRNRLRLEANEDD